jgi:putative phosphoesterase
MEGIIANKLKAYHPKVLLHGLGNEISPRLVYNQLIGNSMRIAFISDIHANFTAFQAVVEDIKGQNPDQIICLGDTVSLGPQPKETLNLLKNLNGVYVKGNHDLAIMNPDQAPQYEIAEHLIPELRWGRDNLNTDDLEFIRSFKTMHELTFPNGIRLLAYHGSPLATTDIILATTPVEVLDKYFEGQSADIFIGGHSHIQMHRRSGAKLILNSGSVGNAFKFAYSPGNPPSLLPWAEYAILEQSGNSVHVDLRRIYFDTDALMKAIMESGLPDKDWWLRQYR